MTRAADYRRAREDVYPHVSRFLIDILGNLDEQTLIDLDFKDKGIMYGSFEHCFEKLQKGNFCVESAANSLTNSLNIAPQLFDVNLKGQPLRTDLPPHAQIIATLRCARFAFQIRSVQQNLVYHQQNLQRLVPHIPQNSNVYSQAVQLFNIIARLPLARVIRKHVAGEYGPITGQDIINEKVVPLLEDLNHLLADLAGEIHLSENEKRECAERIQNYVNNISEFAKKVDDADTSYQLQQIASITLIVLGAILAASGIGFAVTGAMGIGFAASMLTSLSIFSGVSTTAAATSVSVLATVAGAAFAGPGIYSKINADKTSNKTVFAKPLAKQAEAIVSEANNPMPVAGR